MAASDHHAPHPGEAVGAIGPDFVGIGAQRTGSSWIFACLYDHPEICMPRKEINFFSRDRNWRRGLGWYRDIFAECPNGSVRGEFSTSYLTAPEACLRLASSFPEVRLLVSLRHPVERAYSSYLNDIVTGKVPPAQGFAEALAERPEYVDYGRYGDHLGRYLESFRRDRILILLFEDARREPMAQIRSIFDFLGVEPSFEPAMIARPVGRGRVPRFQRLEQSLIGVAGAARRRRALRPLWWAAKRSGLGDRLRALNTRSAGPGEMAPADRARLLDRFEPDVAAVEELLGRELPEWRA